MLGFIQWFGYFYGFVVDFVFDSFVWWYCYYIVFSEVFVCDFWVQILWCCGGVDEGDGFGD